MEPRVPTRRYVDPLDQVWLGAAERIGLAIERTDRAYATTDGRRTLALGHGEHLDSDDCLAQMIFHELCHSLIEGPESFERPDWGLDNTGPRDLWREHACLRLQALLSAPFGLREVLAPTTDHRAFYDRLGADPLEPRIDPASIAAIRGWQRAGAPPWAPHLQEALDATARIARAASGYAAESSSLWATAEPAAAKHPVGEHHGFVADRRCAECAWHYRGGKGKPVSRCRQVAGARIDPSWQACLRWEAKLACAECGACCREAYHSVTVSRRDPVVTAHPTLVVDRGQYLELCREGDRCAALAGDLGTFACTIYEDRPRCCRDLETGGEHCLTARRRVALSR